MERSYYGDYETILKNTNARLPLDLQIRSDDPSICLLIVVDEMLNCYIAASQKMLIEIHEQLISNQQLEMARAKITMERLIDHSKDHLEQQLNGVGEHWQKCFRQSAQEELDKVKEARQLSIYGAGLILASGAIIFGMMLGNLLFSGKP